MSSHPKVYLTPQEYLEIERTAEGKSEYVNGEMFAMSGATRQHNIITINVAASLHSQLRKRDCTVYSSDQRVKVSATGLFTYPDISVVCGEAKFEDARQDTLVNPTVIVEVLSKSTEGYDRNEKFAHYRRMESLKQYLLVSQFRHHLELYSRLPDGQWVLTETDDPVGEIHLSSVHCVLSMPDVYEKVEFA